MSQQAMALLKQKGGNNEVSILTVLEVDVPSADDDAGKNTSHTSRVLSDVSSVDTSTGGGTTVAGEVEGEYPPLPVDYTFNYSASSPNLPGGGDKPDGDNADDDLEIDLNDEQVSKYNFFERLAHYLDEHQIPMAIARLLS